MCPRRTAHDARASLQHAHARLHDASIVHPRARFPLAGGAARRTHAAPPACLRYQGVAIETARRDSSRGARLRPTVRCCQGHGRRAPRLFVGRSHAHPVGTILAYVVCWACLYSAQRAKSMPCVSCSECVRVQYPLAASRCSCSLSRRKVASREGSNYACILFTIVRMHASTLSSIAYACIPLKSSITRYRTTHFFVGIRFQAQGCVWGRLKLCMHTTNICMLRRKHYSEKPLGQTEACFGPSQPRKAKAIIKQNEALIYFQRYFSHPPAAPGMTL